LSRLYTHVYESGEHSSLYSLHTKVIPLLWSFEWLWLGSPYW